MSWGRDIYNSKRFCKTCGGRSEDVFNLPSCTPSTWRIHRQGFINLVILMYVAKHNLNGFKYEDLEGKTSSYYWKTKCHLSALTIPLDCQLERPSFD